jgi:hypothetical protein
MGVLAIHGHFGLEFLVGPPGLASKVAAGFQPADAWLGSGTGLQPV